jgi:hypothetical protein
MEDEAWRTQFIYEKNKLENHNISSINNCRFRDWGTLKYVLRSIDKFAPFINNVFLVVQMESQVPKWLNRETVKVVLHEEFMPEEVLPTYSSCAIEMYLHLIPGLSEKFIYFNDDMILWNKCRPEDFFIDDKCVNSLRVFDPSKMVASDIAKLGDKMYRYIDLNSTEFPYQVLGINLNTLYTTQHNPSAFIKSINNDLYEKAKNIIKSKSYKFRCEDSLTQYMYIMYSVICNKCINILNLNQGVMRWNNNTAASINKNVFNGIKQICINDRVIDELNDDSVISFNNVIKILNIKFDKKCKYENSIGCND